MRSKRRRKSRFWPWGAAILVIAGGATAWVLLQRNLLPGDTPAGVQLVPQDAAATVSIATDGNQWQQAREFGTPETQAVVNNQLATWRDSFLTANGYEYERDIQPWLGKEITIAYLSSEQSSAVAVLLPIAKPTELQQILTKPNGEKSPKLVERNYQGIQIRETPESSVNRLSLAVVGNFVVVTNEPKATERIIDTYKGAPALPTVPGYREAWGQIQVSQPFARLYLNVPAASAIAATTSARPLSPASLAQLQQKQGVAVAVKLETEGMKFKGISWFKPDSQQKLVVENNAKTMASRLPEETLVAIAGGNLQRLWQDYTQGAQANPLSPISPEMWKAGLKSKTGLDLEQDLLPWMAGEFSLSLIPTSQETPSGLGAAVLFMVQTSDRRAAETSLKQLDVVMAKEYQFYVQETQLGDRPMVTWTSPLNGLSATHGWLDGNVAFLLLGAPVTGAIVPKPKVPITENKLFQQTVGGELSANNGYFFIDFDKTINAGNLALPQLSPDLRKFAQGIRGLGVTAAISSDRSSRFDILVLMKKASNVPPLPSSKSSPIFVPSPKKTAVPKKTGVP
jgi:Protein of unknown function (DUF3352)